MDVELQEIKVSDLVANYEDNGDAGVRGYDGRLDIRPPYQREFIYKDAQRDAVIDTIKKGFPLNVMYWAVREDGTYEIIDGQQRTISIAQYIEKDFSFEGLYFHNLTSDKQKRILDYELTVYLCSGTDEEKLEWFKTINIAGEELSNQELRNAVYAGSWVSDAKRYFSKNGCAAYQIGKDYVNKKLNRQGYLETAIKWISGGNIEDYMGKHQDDPDAAELWKYFESVMEWVSGTFIVKRESFMKGVDWGSLYNAYKDEKLDPDAIEKEVAKLIENDEVTSKPGIYPYIFNRDEKHLNIRVFDDAIKQKVYERQSGVCPVCGGEFELNEMEADHITPWSEGGKTNEDNCQMLCKKDNRRKSSR